MMRVFKTAIATATLLAGATGVQAVTNFQADVNAAIDAGLAYSRANNYFTTFNYGNGLSLLTLLEKATLPAGYAGLDTDDRTLARKAACLMIDDGNFGDRGSFYSYYDGQVLMALAVYAETGGPDKPGEVFGSYDCSARSVRETMNKVVDRSIAAQTPSGTCAGYWGYTGTGCDASTTQFTASGLGAAKGYYLTQGDPGGRLPAILTALDLTSNAYSANGKVSNGIYLFSDADCKTGAYPAGCLGHGYQQNYGAPGSNQQTASGTWLQLLGTGKNVNNASVQGYMRWLRSAYNYNTNIYPESWGASYFYYLWSSSKAYNFMETMSVNAGNIGPADLGTLTAMSTNRLQNRVVASDSRVPQRGTGGVGYYIGTPAGWYYDYAYRIMSLQDGTSGLINNPNGGFGYGPSVDHAYALLVLQRSVGGIVVNAKCDVNGDGKITAADLALISAGRGKPATGPNDPRDADNNGQITILDVKKCTPLVH